MHLREVLRSRAAGRPGTPFRLLSVGHALIGCLAYRREIADIARGGVVNSVGLRGNNATAFWFLLATVPMWEMGRLADLAERNGESAALAQTGLLGLGIAGVGGACMPVSGFWGLLACSANLLRSVHCAPKVDHHTPGTSRAVDAE
jgi:hypothetical protein